MLTFLSHRRRFAALGSALFLAVATAPAQEPEDIEAHFEKNSRRAAARDSFPVLEHPKLSSIEEAESQRAIFERDLVLGIAHEGEAKAYPIPVLGRHELGNDTIGGVPIALSW